MTDRKTACVLALVTAAALSSLLVPHWRPGWDSAVYVLVSESIAAGDGVSYAGYDQVKLPPGFPVLLAPIVATLGRDWIWLRGIGVASAALVVALTYLLLTRRCGRGAAAAVALSTGMSGALWEAACGVTSDLPALALTLAALLAWSRFGERPSKKRLAFALALVVAATSVRLVAGLAGLAGGAALLLRPPPRRWRAATAALAVAIAGPALWLLAGTAAQPLPPEFAEGSPYLREVASADWRNLDAATVTPADIVDRVASNARFYGATLAAMTAGRVAEGSMWGVAAIVALIAAGLTMAFRTTRSEVEWLFLLHLCVLLAWPAQEVRLALPLLPFSFLYGGRPLAYVASRWPAPWRRRILLTLPVIVLVLQAGSIWDTVRIERQNPYADGRRGRQLAAMSWLTAHVPPDALVITDRAPWCYLVSGRRTLSFPRTTRSDLLLKLLDRVDATHVLLDASPPAVRYLTPVLARYPERFREVGRRDEHVLFLILR